MPDAFLSETTGLTNSKLSIATATPSDVLEGKTFYSGDDTLKSGSYNKPSDHYDFVSNYNGPDSSVNNIWTFHETAHYSITLQYSTGWICYMVVRHGSAVLLQTVNTATSGTQTFEIDVFDGDTFSVEMQTDGMESSNRYVNTSMKIVRVG